VAPPLARSLQVAGLAQPGGTGPRVFVDLDHALEHAENGVLGIESEPGPRSGLEVLEATYPGLGVRQQVLTYCDRLTWQPGDLVVRQSEPADAMLFIESGRLTAWREVADSHRIRLSTIVPGTVVGGVGFYLHAVRQATVIADRDSSAFRITREALRRMQRENPALASMFHRFMATIAAERAGDNVRQLATRNA
jgi:SulP family sulfate permease